MAHKSLIINRLSKVTYAKLHKLLLTVTLVLIAAAACSGQKIEQRYTPLDLGRIRAEGWIKDWAQTAADGITGHLDEYEQVFEYGWLGCDISARQSDGDGKVSSTGWLLEQSAYWLDGSLKTGAVLGDTALFNKAARRLDGVVDGVLASENNTFIHWKPDSIVVVENGDYGKGSFNNWAHGLMGRCLVSYWQATHDQRILSALEKVYSSGYYLKAPQEDIYAPDAGLSQGMVRGAINLDAMSETYLLTGNKKILKAMMDYAAEPSQKDEEQRLLAKQERRDRNWGDATIHGVTLNEVARVPALLSMWTADRQELEATVHLLDWVDKYNKLPFGLNSAEEWLSGTGPYRFTETCDIPAAMWTRTWMLRITGESRWADDVERAFLNAGPVPVSRDFKTMCYYQSPNRIDEGTPPAPPIPGPGRQIVYTPTGNKTLCCVGSCNWIIPNYVQNMWMRAAGGGLACVLYGPCTVETDGISLKCETDFPFGEDQLVAISTSRARRMPIYFRIPSWCKGMSVSVNGQALEGSGYGGFLRICRKWKDGDVVRIHLPMEASVHSITDNCYPQDPYFIEPHWGRINTAALDTLAGRTYKYVDYGPLLYALPLYDIDENTVVPGQESAYTMAAPDVSDIEVISGKGMPEHWGWRIEDAPTVLKVPAQLDGRDTTITLVPYNCTKFRVSMFRDGTPSRYCSSSG